MFVLKVSFMSVPIYIFYWLVQNFLYEKKKIKQVFLGIYAYRNNRQHLLQGFVVVVFHARVHVELQGCVDQKRNVPHSRRNTCRAKLVGFDSMKPAISQKHLWVPKSWGWCRQVKEDNHTSLHWKNHEMNLNAFKDWQHGTGSLDSYWCNYCLG